METVRQLITYGTKVVVEAANIPTTPEEEKTLTEKGVWVMPDFVVNAGGVIGSYEEYKGGTDYEAFELIKQKITANVKLILTEADLLTKPPRQVTLEIAAARVKRAMLLRRGALEVAR